MRMPRSFLGWTTTKFVAWMYSFHSMPIPWLTYMNTELLYASRWLTKCRLRLSEIDFDVVYRSDKNAPGVRRTVEITNWWQKEDWLSWKITCMKRRKDSEDSQKNTLRPLLRWMQRRNQAGSRLTQRRRNQKEWDKCHFGVADGTPSEAR